MSLFFNPCTNEKPLPLPPLTHTHARADTQPYIVAKLRSKTVVNRGVVLLWMKLYVILTICFHGQGYIVTQN